ncbi:MAG: hypothetical protein A3A86_00700 [Elusimicrobia bacterium RIFCSPLOWO2_01_FULL_60_11]|nr:MAG: hypothetical protein A3A86_00700 [Elusimicrobia bacterium RIFCSPLOWO2_01_FULL_60_11]
MLGMSVVFNDGKRGDFGGKVVKNVAGYDMAKLFLGSRGTLGRIVSATLKTYPMKYPGTVRPGPARRTPDASARRTAGKILAGLRA